MTRLTTGLDNPDCGCALLYGNTPGRIAIALFADTEASQIASSLCRCTEGTRYSLHIS